MDAWMERFISESPNSKKYGKWEAREGYIKVTINGNIGAIT